LLVVFFLLYDVEKSDCKWQNVGKSPSSAFRHSPSCQWANFPGVLKPILISTLAGQLHGKKNQGYNVAVKKKGIV
jgi:hypothetical protein